MKIRILSLLFMTAAFMAFSSGSAFSQDGAVDGPPDARPDDRFPDMRMNMLRQLGLSRPQIQEIRLINMRRKPLMDAAQKQFHDANRRLDEAIYSDSYQENDVAARIKDVQLAQNEITKLRFESEIAIRKVLTPDQLNRFRELRQQFEIRRRRMVAEEKQMWPADSDNRPNNPGDRQRPNNRLPGRPPR
jgi:Spy/CpxP family protein refolding chaperone